MKVLTIALAVMMLAGCDNGTSTKAKNSLCDPHIGLVGDSLTRFQGWPERLSEEHELRIHAYSGLTSASWLPRTATHKAETFTSCVYVVLLGTNDSGFGIARPWTEFQRNMRAIANDLVRKHKANRVILMIPPPRVGNDVVSAFSNNLLGRYRSALFDLCEESFEDAIVCGPDLFMNARPAYFRDRVHLSSLGTVWVYEELSWFLEHGARKRKN